MLKLNYLKFYLKGLEVWVYHDSSNFLWEWANSSYFQILTNHHREILAPFLPNHKAARQFLWKQKHNPSLSNSRNFYRLQKRCSFSPEFLSPDPARLAINMH